MVLHELIIPPYNIYCGQSLQYIQSTLVIENSKGLSETHRDIRTSKYQSCGSEENNKSNNHIQHEYVI